MSEFGAHSQKPGFKSIIGLFHSNWILKIRQKTQQRTLASPGSRIRRLIASCWHACPSSQKTTSDRRHGTLLNATITLWPAGAWRVTFSNKLNHMAVLELRWIHGLILAPLGLHSPLDGEWGVSWVRSNHKIISMWIRYIRFWDLYKDNMWMANSKD